MKCSILVANFNSAKFIENFIASVYKQDYEVWELIIVDDCSTDEGLILLKDFLIDSRIKIFVNENNYGVGYTKKKAASLATGEVLMFADPDDALCANALSIMVNEHKNYPNASLIYSTFYNCDEYLNIIGVARWVGELKKPDTNLHADVVSHLASFKKIFYDKTDGINPLLFSAVDKDLYYKLEEVGELIYIDKPLYMYRKNSAGVSQSYNSILASENSLQVIKNAYIRRISSGYPNISLDIIRKKEAVHFHYKALLLALNGVIIEAIINLFESFMRDPSYKIFQKIKIGLLYYSIKHLLKR